MYLIYILYDDGKVCEFLTKDPDYVRIACTCITQEDNCVEIKVKYIKEKK